MKSLGIVRKIDNLGRVVLPKELRKVMNLEEGTPMEFFTTGNQIVISKYSPNCVFCSGEGTKTLNRLSVCDECIKKLNG